MLVGRVLHVGVVATVAGELALALTLRILDIVEPGRGHQVLAVVGLVWLVPLVLTLAALMRRLQWSAATLADREEEMRAAAAISHDWLWQASPNLVATGCSPAVSEVLGYAPEQIIGRSLFDFLHDDDVPRAQALLGSAAGSRIGWNNVQLRWRHADGRIVTLQGSGMPVYDRDGQLTGFRGARRADPGLPADRDRDVRIHRRLDGVISGDQLTIAFQPIVDLPSGRCFAVEALARFPDGRPPDLWFAEAHTVDRGVDLELTAIRAALLHLPAFPSPVRMTVNASPAAILDRRFSALFEGLPLHRITVEITEHEVVALYEDLHTVLQPLRAAGLCVAVDDTGAGYASFSHVLQLRPDVIKLDRGWLTDLTQDQARRTLVTAVVLLALDLGASVTAEGVETEEQLRTLADLGVDHVQGYLLARPATERHVWTQWTQQSWSAVAGGRQPLRAGPESNSPPASRADNAAGSPPWRHGREAIPNARNTPEPDH